MAGVPMKCQHCKAEVRGQAYVTPAGALLHNDCVEAFIDDWLAPCLNEICQRVVPRLQQRVPSETR